MRYGPHVIEVTGRSGPNWEKWYTTCSCGYRAVVRRTEDLAWEAGAHHLVLAAKRMRDNGYGRIAAL